MGTGKALLAKAYSALDERRRRALRYAASKLDTDADADSCFDREQLGKYVERAAEAYDANIDDDDEPEPDFRAFLGIRAALLAIAKDPADDRIDKWLGSEQQQELLQLTAAMRALRSGRSEELLALSPTAYLGDLHPVTMCEWADAVLRANRADDASDLIEALLTRAPSMVEAYQLVKRLRELEDDKQGQRVAKEIVELLSPNRR